MNLASLELNHHNHTYIFSFANKTYYIMLGRYIAKKSITTKFKTITGFIDCLGFKILVDRIKTRLNGSNKVLAEK